MESDFFLTSLVLRLLPDYGFTQYLLDDSVHICLYPGHLSIFLNERSILLMHFLSTLFFCHGLDLYTDTISAT